MTATTVREPAPRTPDEAAPAAGEEASAQNAVAQQGFAGDGPAEPTTWRAGGAAARVAVASGLTVAAAEPFLVAFAPGARPAVTLAAVGVPAGVGLLAGAGRRWPASLRTTVVAAAFVTAVLVVYRPGVGLLSGPHQLLTGARPVDASGAVFAAVVVSVGVAGLVAAELCLRPRFRLAPAFPALVLFVAALAVTGSRPTPGWAAPALVVFAGLLLAVRPAPTSPLAASSDAVGAPARGGHSRNRYGWRLVSGSLLTVGAVAAAGVLASTGVVVAAGEDAERYDARDLVRPPRAPDVRANPMAQLFALRAQPRDLFRIQTTTDARDDSVRLLVLPVFDGVSWNAADRYRTAGRVLPRDPDMLHTSSVRVNQSITVLDRELTPWLPSIGRPVEVSAAGLWVDEHSGDVVLDDQAAGDPVEVVGALPGEGDKTQVRTARPAPPSHPLPDSLRDELARYPETSALTSAVAPGRTTFDGLAALEAWFRAGVYRLDTSADAPAGNGVYAIRQLLTTHVGTAEQYASAFALAALQLGFDARVVLGFTPGDASEGRTVRTADVHAWPEVRFEGIGWVEFQPTPSAAGSGSPVSVGPPTQQDTVRSAAAEALASQPPTAGTGSPGSAQPVPPAGRPAGTARGLLAVAGGMLPLLAVAVPAAKAVRRLRRRRAPLAAARIDGAWRDTVDRLLESGIATQPALTRYEVSLAAREKYPRADFGSLDDLRVLADAAAFSGVPSDDRDAVRAWQLADRVGRQIGGVVPVPRRLAATFDIRPLLSRRV